LFTLANLFDFQGLSKYLTCIRKVKDHKYPLSNLLSRKGVLKPISGPKMGFYLRILSSLTFTLDNIIAVLSSHDQGLGKKER